MLLRHAREVVVVHEHLVPFHDGLGPKIRVESPFIPPDTNEEHSIVATYPDWVMPFVGWNEGYVILNSASRFDESDLYGFLASVKLVHRLNERGIRARLLFAFVSFEQRLVPDDMRNLISNLQGRGLLRILNGNFEIWPLFKRVDVFLRTTATDGESVSILEALHFSCPTVASNVVPRPYGVSTYQFGEMGDLVDVVTKVLLKEQS